MKFEDGTLNSAWWALKLGLGLGPFLAGLDKFFNLLTNWQMYLNPNIERLLPISGETFMHAVGVIEMSNQQTRFVPITDRRKLTGALLVGIGFGMWLGWRRHR